MLDHFRAMADGESDVEIVGAFLGQENGENLEVHQPLDLLRGAGEHLIEIQRRVDFMADLGEYGQRLRRDFRRQIEFCRVHL